MKERRETTGHGGAEHDGTERGDGPEGQPRLEDEEALERENRSTCVMAVPRAHALSPERALGLARQAAENLFGEEVAAEPGLLVACVGPLGTAEACFAPYSKEPAVVVGRHSQCHVRIPDESPDMPLRHVLLWHEGTSQAPVTRVVDLRTHDPVELHGFGTIDGARIDGPAGLKLGCAQLLFAPVGAGERLGSALPSALPSIDVIDAKTGTGTEKSPKFSEGQGSQRKRRTSVGLMLPARELTGMLPAFTEDTFLSIVVTIEEHAPVALHLTRADFERGVLIGRYSRCQEGLRDLFPGEISRVHLALLLQDDKPLAIDTASTAGTWLAEQRVPYVELSSGPCFGVGELVTARAEPGPSLQRRAH